MLDQHFSKQLQIACINEDIFFLTFLALFGLEIHPILFDDFQVLSKYIP